MSKRLIFAVVGAAMGTLVGLVITAVAGVGQWVVLAAAAAGAASPVVLGPPGK
ncbi:MAG TPA: hypothetical protein VN442_24405 [Bryobacteraceae bacterium]|nr:hypothetical protein [Bryobacteraceae bacterium]